MRAISNNSFFQNKKAYLMKYRLLAKKAERTARKLDQAELELVTVKSPSFNGLPKTTARITLDDKIARKEQLEDQFKREIKQASKKRSEIYELIDGLDNQKQAEVLDQYFIQQKTLEAIAEDMHYSISYIKKLYKQGIEAITIKEFGGGANAKTIDRKES